MSDVLKKIVTIFEPDGTIQREYKTVQFDGEGAPRDADISPGDRNELYGKAHVASTALLSDCQAQRDAARDEAASLKTVVEARDARIAELCEQMDAAVARIKEQDRELTALKA